jgi:hypothetical protein
MFRHRTLAPAASAGVETTLQQQFPQNIEKIRFFYRQALPFKCCKWKMIGYLASK